MEMTNGVPEGSPVGGRTSIPMLDLAVSVAHKFDSPTSQAVEPVDWKATE